MNKYKSHVNIITCITQVDIIYLAWKEKQYASKPFRYMYYNYFKPFLPIMIRMVVDTWISYVSFFFCILFFFICKIK